MFSIFLLWRRGKCTLYAYLVTVMNLTSREVKCMDQIKNMVKELSVQKKVTRYKLLRLSVKLRDMMFRQAVQRQQNMNILFPN